MIAASNSQEKRVVLSLCNGRFFNSQLSFLFRYCTLQENCNNYDKDKKEEGKCRKTCSKNKKTKSMARLINGRPWSSEVDSSLSSLCPLSRTTVLQVLRLIRNSSKAIEFFDWSTKMGFSHNEQSCFLLLEILGRARNLNAARNFLFSVEKRLNGAVKVDDKLFNSLIRSYGNAGLFQKSVKLFALMKSMGVSPSVVSFNSLLLILLKRGRTTMAKSVYYEMLDTYGVTPDTYTFNILIRGFCKNSMVDEGFRFFKEMSEFNCDPDVVTYNTLVDGLCRGGKVRIAHNVVKGMVRKGEDSLNPNVVTYTTLVRGYCMKQEISEALDVFVEMVSRGVKPNDITYNTLIKGLCEANKIDKIKEILEGALAGGEFTPDACTFNTLIDAFCKVRNLNEGWKVFEKMTEMNIKPDSATYSILIRNLCEHGNFEKAEMLFDELSRNEILSNDEGSTPLVASYNLIFSYLCANGKTNKAERVFRQLMKRGTQDPPSYKTLIMGHCKEGTFEFAYELLVLMLRRDFKPDFEIFEALIDGLLKMGNAQLAFQTLEKMLKSSYLPKSCTFHSVLTGLLNQGFAHESAVLVLLMLERKVTHNVNLSTQTVKLLFERGLKDKAFKLVGSIYANGYILDMENLLSYLRESRKLRAAQKMLLFCLENHCNINLDICDIVIEGLCKTRGTSEAFELYYKLVEEGDTTHKLKCLEGLKIALEAKGMSEEAKFVSKRMSTTTCKFEQSSKTLSCRSRCY